VANLLSAKKRIRQNEVRRMRNRQRKSNVRTHVRKFTDAVHAGDLDQAREALRVVSKLLDQTAAKGTIHRNAASRKKSRLARRLNKAQAVKTE
jgi:small subunit ribosomal protein S20